MKLIKDNKHRGMYHFYCPGCKCIHQIAISENDCGFPVWKCNGDMEKPTVEPSVKVEYHGADKDTVCHSFEMEKFSIYPIAHMNWLVKQ